jgi:hypothetical protein
VQQAHGNLFLKKKNLDEGNVYATLFKPFFFLIFFAKFIFGPFSWKLVHFDTKFYFVNFPVLEFKRGERNSLKNN